MPKIGSARDRILARASALEEDRKKQNEQQQTKLQQTKLQKITTAKQRIQKRAAALEQERKKQMQNAPAATNPTVNTPSSTNRVEESVKPAQKVNRRFQTVAERAADKQASTNPRANGNSGGESNGRVSKGVQSIGLKIPATFEYLGEGAKTARDNAAEYQNSELKERADAALNDIKLAKALYGEGSEQHLKAQADYDALRKEIVAYQKSPDKVVDANSRASQFMSGVHKLEEEALDGTSGAVRDLGEIALSMGNNLALMPFNAILPGATLAMMGAEAAADRAYELQQRGVTADSAMTRGLVAGGIEALTEKIGLDNLMDIVKVGGKSVLMNIAKQAMAEGGEEGLSYAMNYLADKAAGDPEAAFVLNDFAKSIGMGAVSGALFGAGGTAIYALGNQPEADFIQQTGRARTTPDEISLHLQQSDPVMEQAMELLQEQMGASNAETVFPNAENVLEERNDPVLDAQSSQEQISARDEETVNREEKAGETASAPETADEWADIDGKSIREELDRRKKEGSPFVERVMQDVDGLGEYGKQAFTEMVESQTAPEEQRTFQTAYEAGKAETPRDALPFVSQVQESAYEAGRKDRIMEGDTQKTADQGIENPGKQQYDNGKKKTSGKKRIRTKKSDWASTDVSWTLPGEVKSPIAYSTKATSDLIEALSDENPTATISELKGLVTYDQEAKRVLQQYIDAGYGEQVASEWFSYDRKRGIQPTKWTTGVMDEVPDTPWNRGVIEGVKEETTNGESTQSEVHDGGAVLEPDLRGESTGRLLDGLAAQDLQEDARSGNPADVLPGDGGSAGRSAVRSDAERDERGRSVGSGEGTDLRTSSGEVIHLTDDEAGAANDYKSSESYKVNAKLRVGETLNQREQSIVDGLDSALKKLPVHKGKLYRNIGFDLFGGKEARDEFMAQHIVGMPVRYDAYTSTSTKVDGYIVDDDFAVHMEIEGINGRDMAGIGNNFEDEVLFQRESYFIVDKIEYSEDGTPYIYMTEVSNEERGTEGVLRGDREREQNQSAGSKNGEVRDVQTVSPENPEMQEVSDRDTEGHSGGSEDLSDVQREVTTEQQIEQKTEEAVQENPRGSNFSIPEDGLKLPKGEKARYKANVAAIKTLRNIMAENRYATAEEQAILSKYVGWGGLANVFDANKSDWAKEYKELKGLLSDKEYSSAKGSTLNAHYTEVGVIRGIYKGLSGIGFKGGRLLEPSAGVGHFAGAMPQDMLPGVKSWTMVELDSITGNIAKYLYPNADVRVQGFETAKIPDNYMDMAISNVPFGNYAIADKTYPKAVTSAIHNYFFAKSLDKVRPGGIVCFITSRYTMDARDSSVRQYIMQRADLLGAIRLPDSAFKSNAGTEVVTDILVLKKREPGTKYSGETFETTGYHHQNLGIYEQTNDYFSKHPEMVLGEAAATGSMYRSNSLTYTAKGGNLEKQIEKAFSKIKGKMDYPVQRTQEEIRAEIKADAAKGKDGSIVVKDGQLYRKKGDTLEKAADITKANTERMTGIVGIRDTARKLLDMQMDGGSDAEIKKLRESLNTQYDAFVKKHGILHAQNNLRLLKMDVDAPFIQALEDYDKDTKTATKAAIFTKNTVSPTVTVTHVDTVADGMTVSINETGGVDAERIAQLTGKTAEAVKRELLDSRLVFKNRNGELEQAEKYLSGNVRAKLKDAEALAEGDPDYAVNVEELKKIIPADVPAEDISVQPGSTWIPDAVYSDFVAETLGSRNSEYRKAATVTYNKLLGTYSVTLTDQWLKNRPENTSTWGTTDRSFVNIFEATLNSKNVTVWRKLDDGSRYLDKQATAAVQEKQEKIRAEFKRWLWSDEKRKTDLSRLYNDVFNNTVTPKYDGSKLTVNGSNAEKGMYPHQKDVVQRIINSGGNTLIAHKVGAGKTYEMSAAAMKLRQLGIVKKPVFVVPKSLVSQWGREFLDFFPAAKILVLPEKAFTAENRKIFANRIATGDYDAVIMSQEQFKAVPMSMENQEAFYQDQITALELAMEEAARVNGKRDPSIKQMERSKKSFEAKLKKLGDMKKDTDNIDFEQMGIDALFVDEAHSYKNLFYTTNMSNVSGLGSKEGSQKAFDLYMKVRYLQKLNGGRGVVFATATPVMNSMSEMYIMQKYLQGDLLDARGLQSFDAWANQFGEVRTVLEMNPSGKGFRQKQSFSRFKNLAELQQMFRSFADVLTDIPGLKIPKMKDGHRIIVECEPSEFQMQYIDKLAERSEAIKNRKVDPKDDNMLKITSEGRKLSYTQRMIDPSLPYEEDNKIMKCANNVLQIWKDSKDINGTQLIFCDLSTPKGSANTETTTEAEVEESAEDISIYDDIRNALISAGVPAGEVAFIHDANTNDKKAKLFQDVNDGKVRVLIGSTGKMGVGMNAQKRIVALHHLDAPWRPGDIEQREGRALRRGNINEEVGIYVYITKKTFDGRMWDNLQRKATFIHQIMAGDLSARESEGDGDFALSAAEIKAIASGNPLIIEQVEVSAEINRLENLERAHAKEVAQAKKRIADAEMMIARDTGLLADYKADLASRQDTTGDKFRITVNGRTITERKAAGEAIIALAKQHADINPNVQEKTFAIGKFAGFDLLVNNKGEVLLRGKGQYRAAVNMQAAEGTIRTLENIPRRLDSMVTTVETRISENRSAIGKLEKTASSGFDKADELAQLRKRNAEIMLELNPADEQNVAALDDEEGDTVHQSRDSMTDHSDQWTAERVGSTEKAPMRVAEIVEKIRHDFGLNITTGHIRSAGVRGQFNDRDQGIRTKIANDLPTISHELGHALSLRYGLLDELTGDMESELETALGEGKDAYDKKEWHSEGLAEYVRQYLQNRETAAISYPEFTAQFKSKLSGKDAALIDQLADEVNAYYSLDADTATSNIRLREEKNPDARTFGEKIKAKASVLYQAWLDGNQGIKEFDKATGGNTYKLATNAAYSDAMAGQIIVGDLTDANGQYVGPGLKTVLNGLDLSNKEEYRLFGEYLTVKHGPERLAERMRVFADDRKNSTNWMQRRQQELESQYPQFKEISERLYEFQAQVLQTWGVDTGLISAETAKEWGERWSFYVPLNRAVSESKRGIGAKRGFANQNSTIKRAKGSGLDVIHPVDNIVNNLVKMVNAGVRNNVMRAITDTAETLSADAAFIEKIPTPMKRSAFDMTGTKEQLVSQMQEIGLSASDLEAVEGEIANIDDILYQYGRGKAHGSTITVLKNGNPEFWKVNDPQLLESVTTMNQNSMEGILAAYGAVSRFMTSNITGNNVIWSIFSNAPRDLMTMYTYSKEKNPLKLFKEVGAAYVNKAKMARNGSVDPLYKEFLAMGGGKTSAYTADRNLAKKARKSLIDKKINPNPLDWIGFVSDVVESGPRFATYKLMRQAGMSPQEAFYEAMDITVNFRRGGRLSRELNKVVPFFNASMQGLDKFRRWISAEDAGATNRAKVVRTRVTSYLAVSAALAAIFYALNNGDEEKEKEYEQLSNYTKNSYWNIPVGDGKYFSIPKPRELGVLSSFLETCMELFIGGNEYAFEEFYDYATENCLPNVADDLAQLDLAGLVGNLGIIGVASYMVANRDFLGKPIVSASLQYYEPKDQYTDRTSKIAYWIGRAFNQSPQMIDYAMQQILGGWWKAQKALFPVGEKQRDYTLGVRNTYIKDNQYSTDLINWLYDHADKTAKAKKSDAENMDKAIAAKLDSNMSTFYSRYYGLEKSASVASRSTRQTVLDMVLEYRKSVDSGELTDVQKAVNEICKNAGSTENMPSVMQTEVKDGSGEKHKLSDIQYVEYQTDYLRLYWETVEQSLPDAKTDAEKLAVLKAAKDVAKEEAANRTLARIGAPQTDYATKYKDVEKEDVAVFKAQLDLADDDGSLKQDEVIDIVFSMIQDGLSFDDAYTLFHSRYDSDKNNPWANHKR